MWLCTALAEDDCNNLNPSNSVSEMRRKCIHSRLLVLLARTTMGGAWVKLALYTPRGSRRLLTKRLATNEQRRTLRSQEVFFSHTQHLSMIYAPPRRNRTLGYLVRGITSQKYFQDVYSSRTWIARSPQCRERHIWNTVMWLSEMGCSICIFFLFACDLGIRNK